MQRAWKYALAVLGCEAVGSIGALFVRPSALAWYGALARPSFAPPNWLFAPVWILLYALMGVALVLMLERRQPKHDRLESETWFYAQLALNGLWTPVFFGLESPWLGLVVIVALWCALAGTILRFEKISKPAGWLLVPYLAWVSYALLLNFAIWRLN